MNENLSLDEQLLQRLPLPLAQLCRRSQNAKTPLEQHLAAYYLWEAALKLLGATTVVEYAALNDPNSELAEKLESLARPSLGHWWEFVRRLVPVLADKNDKGFTKVRELLLGRARDDLPRAAGLYAALLEILEGKSGARSTVRLTELFDRLVTYRNRELGHGAAGQKPTDFYRRMGQTLLAAFTQLLGQLDVVAGRHLIYVADVRRLAAGGWLIERYALVSESPRRLEPLQLPEAATAYLPRPECVYLEGQLDPQVPFPFPTLRLLHPLLHYDSETGKLFFLNARRGKRQMEYLCYSTGEVLSREPAGEEQRALLAKVLGRPVDAVSADDWAARSQAGEPAVADSLLAGERSIGEFELLSRLGQGGMGVVYRAWQPSLGRQVALKCMLRSGDPKAEARFAREIRALGRIEHPNIVKVFTSGAQGDQWFYAMELIEGAELAHICAQLTGSTAADIDETRWHAALSSACEEARSHETPISNSRSGPSKDALKPASPTPSVPPSTPHGALPVGGRNHIRQVVEIIRKVAEAVHALHEAGVVHRDIKPGNIMLTADGAHPVLMDLGLAQLADETDGRLTRTRQFVGTLRYASPEQVLAAGKVDRRTDIYSVGATLWELLTLRPIFGADDDMPTPDLMLKIQTTDAERVRKHNPRVPRDLEAVVMKCLEKDRTRRYATAAELAADLGRWQGGEPVLAQPPSLSYLLSKYVRRYWVALAVAAVMLLVVVINVVLAFLKINEAKNQAVLALKNENEAKNQAVLALENEKEARVVLEEQQYDNYIAVAERELTLNQDVSLASTLLKKCPKHLRGWEWDYLMRLRDGPQAPLAGHESGLWMAVFSPDGRSLATASIDGTVKVWDVASRHVRFTFRGHALLPVTLPGIPRVPVMCVAFSPDGRHIASGSFSPNPVNLRESRGIVKIWDAETGREILTFREQRGVVLSLAYSHDGRRIASSSINDDNTFVVWDTETGQVIQVVRGHTSHVHRLRYSPNGELLVSASTDGTVKVWDAATLKLVYSIDEAHPAPVVDVAFAPDGSRFASAGEDGAVRVWDTKTGTKVLELRGHTGSALAVAYSPDGKRLASGGFDKTVRVWDAASGKEKITLRGHTDMIWSVAFSPDGRQLVSASFDKQARIWDATPQEERTGPGLFTITGHSDRVTGVAFSPDRRYLASSSVDSTVRLWDSDTGAAQRILAGHKGAVWSVAFSPDGKRVASGGWDRKVRIWDAATGRVLLTFAGHTAPVQSVAFSPDGKRVASGSFDAFVKIWDATTGKVLATCQGDLFPTVAVAFSPDGKRLASGRTDRSVVVWDAETGKALFTLKGHEAIVPSVAFSPDGKRLVSASWDHTLKVWDVDPKRKESLFQSREVMTLKGHSDRVNGVAFSPDGTLIASASEDKTVRLWDASTGKEISPPFHHRGLVWSVAFSPDGKRLAAGTWSPSAWVKTWDVKGHGTRLP